MGRAAMPALLLLAATTLEAQELLRPTPSPDSLLAAPNGASVMFDRNQSTDNWLGRVRIEARAWDNDILFSSRYGANIFSVETGTGSRRLQSTNNGTYLLLGRRLSPLVRSQADWSSLVYTDEKDVGLSAASTHILRGGAEYTPVPALTLVPMAGYRWDRQTGIADEGLHLSLLGRTRGLDIDGVLLRAEGRFQEDRLNPRVLEGHFLRGGVQKTFVGRTRDTLQVSVVRNRQEFYTLTDSIRGVESRKETILSFANLLDYEVDPHLLASLFIGLSNRSLGKDVRFPGATETPPPVFGTDINEFRLESFMQVGYESAPGGLAAFLQLSYLERNEEHAAVPGAATPGEGALEARDDQEKRKNNLTRRTALGGMVRFPVGSGDTIRVSGSTSVLRYDTPSRENYEDRDEVLSALSIGAARRFSRTFHAALGLEGTKSHTVYLLAERSGNNSTNYILRLWPTTWFRPLAGFLTVNTFEVLANYTVYDFEQQSAQVRSYAYRQFAWTDSTAVELSRRVGLDFLAQLKLYERGQLRWDEFVERIENAFDERFLALQARFSPRPDLTVAVGYRSFRQRRYSFPTGTKVQDAELSGTGPTCMLLWQPERRGAVVLTGWYERRTQSGGEPRMLPTMTMNVQLNF
jgi:hypothetical protein